MGGPSDHALEGPAGEGRYLQPDPRSLAGWFPFGETEDVLKWAGILLHAATVLVVMLIAQRTTETDAATVPRRKRFLTLATLVVVGWSLYRVSGFVEPFYFTHTGSLAKPPS